MKTQDAPPDRARESLTAPALALALALTLPTQALAAEGWAFLGLSMESHYESWSVWTDDLMTLQGQGSDWDQSPWGPASLLRLSYSMPGFMAMAEYETAEAEFPALGLSQRRRYGLNFENRSIGEISQGVYAGLRYYDFKFARQTEGLRDHEYFEITMGYTLAYNPEAPGPYANFKFMSPTLFWLFLLTTTAKENDAVLLNEFQLPLGAEFMADFGYRMETLPLEFGFGYRLLYYNTLTGDGRSISGAIHGVFARITMGMWMRSGPAPEVGTWGGQ